MKGYMKFPMWLQLHTKQNYIRQLCKARRTSKPTRGLSHYGLAIYIKKYLNAKRRIMKIHRAKI